jgi:GNAT superfamily N-acetyltransferase
MTRTYEIQMYESSDRDAVFSFIKEAYPEALSNRLIRQWDWKYINNPFNTDNTPDIILLKHGEKIVGMEGAIYRHLSVNGEILRIAAPGDMVVHPDYRKLGLSRKILEKSYVDFPLSMGWPNSISKRSVRVMPGKTIRRYRPLVKIIDPVKVYRKKMGKRISSPMPRAGVTGKIVTKGNRVLGGNMSIRKVERFDDRFDSLWQRSFHDYPVICFRDSRYLTWRYTLRPDAEYDILTLLNGTELDGYIIFRVVDNQGMKTGYLVDFLVRGRSLHNFSLLVKSAVEIMKQKGAAIVVTLSFSHAYRLALFRHGFFPLGIWREGYFYARINFPTPDNIVVRNVRKWFLTMGDADLEMSL